MRNGLKLRIVASAAALSLFAAACGGADDAGGTPEAQPTTTTTTTTMPPTTPPTTEAPMDDSMGDDMMQEVADPTQTGAASLRSLLTAQLQEHVYLAGIAVYAAVNTPDAFEAAAGALDQNSQDLAASIASVYGEGAGEAFLALWRTHIGFFVDYTTARATGDEAGQAAAREGLDSYREDFGAFLESANPNLPKEAVAEELIPHVTSVFAAIDAVVDGSPDGFDLLAQAAGHMPMTAAVLAGGIAAQFPDIFGG